MERRLWGLLLLVVGVTALLQGIGVFYFGLSFWPVVLVLLGVALIWGSFSNWVISWFLMGLGLWVGGIGLFDILSNAGVTTIVGGDIVRHGWPVLLVALGVSIMIGDRARLFKWRCREPHGKSHRARGQFYRIGDLYQGREPWKLDGDLDLQHGIGDAVLDLTTAEISEGTHHIRIKAGIGELTIRVPDNVNAEVDAAVSLGELQVLDESRSGVGGLSLRQKILAEDSGVELLIEARLGLGELTVVQSPTSPGVSR